MNLEMASIALMHGGHVRLGMYRHREGRRRLDLMLQWRGIW